ncbi:MAG: 4'-phosphopantetheinyl transferase superfamily protein [Ginsengibacter sp.]
MIHVFYCISQPRLEDHLYNYFFTKIPPFLQDEISKFRNWEDRQHRVFGKLLLIKGLDILGLSDYSINRLRFTNLKRPYFDESMDFNISHSGKYVVCAISTSAKIGIDIEEIKEIPLTDFTDQFSTDEMKNISNADNSMHSFYSLWTKKEAFLKAIGTGLYVPLNKVHVINNTISWKNNDWFLKELPIDNDYCVHICADVLDIGVQIHEIILQDFYSN